MSSLLLDLRHSIRLLRHEKAFTATVVLMLAVCVGVNATVFSVVNAVLLAPLPFPDAERLVVVLSSYPGAGVPRAPKRCAGLLHPPRARGVVRVARPVPDVEPDRR